MGHTEIKRTQWDRIGRRLGEKGKIYRYRYEAFPLSQWPLLDLHYRCRYRNQHTHNGEDKWLPAVFDGISKEFHANEGDAQAAADDDEDAVPLETDDQEEVISLSCP